MRKAQADEIMRTNAHQTNSWLLGGDFCSASLAAWIGAKLCSEAACEYLRVIEGYGACVCVRAPRGGLKTSARARACVRVYARACARVRVRLCTLVRVGVFPRFIPYG